MGKLMDSLTRQLQTENKIDAENCIKIYNAIKERTGKVWASDWQPLVSVRFVGKYPYTKVYKPTEIGKIFLNGL